MNLSINHSSDVLTKTENYLSPKVNKGKFVSINIYDFLKKDLIPQYRNHEVNIKVTYLDKFAENNKSDLIVNADDFLLKEIFSNFIENAINHGFVDEGEHIFTFAIGLTENRERLIIKIGNNGLPLTKGFTIDDFKIFGWKLGDTAGTGIGGATINKYLEILDGTIKVTALEDIAYTENNVEFIITLPKIKN